MNDITNIADIDARVKAQIGERPTFPAGMRHQGHAPVSDDALMQHALDTLNGQDACSAWDREYRRLFHEAVAALNAPAPVIARAA